ncbi:MAG: outer membrane beta-barrel protein [Bacteroidota bacterium]
MKKIGLLFSYLVLSVIIINAQKDTTKIKLGDTKIIIIDNQGDDDASKLTKLEKGKEKFEKLIEEKEKEKENKLKELELLEKRLKESTDEEILKKLEKDLEKQEAMRLELDKELKALEKGVKDIEDEIANEELKNDDDDFDWDSHNDWYSDWDNLSPFNKNKKFRGHWAGFELGLNNYMNEERKTTLDPVDELFELNPERSWVFALNFVEFNIPFTKGSGLVTGMGTTWNNYHFRNNVNVYEDANGVIIAEPETVNNLGKNALNLWYITIPLIFEFQIPVNNNRPGIHVGFGAVGSLKLASKTVQKYDGTKSKQHSDFQIPGLKYGLTFRIGYRFIKLFVNYDMVPLFKEEKGPKVFPVSAGITLISF